MSDIKTFPFSKGGFEDIRAYKFGEAWPVVYILENGKEMYVGETIGAYNRCKQHNESEDRKRLTRIHIITDEEYNKSAALDIEALLIQYMAAEGTYRLQNGNGGLQNHNYYDKEKYQAKFELTWEKLKEMTLVQKDLIQIKNSDVFKYSPYKSLTDDQLMVVKDIFSKIQSGTQKPFIINGKPGTGKTILAVYLVKYLKEHATTKHLEIGLVVPMTSLRQTLKKVFKQVSGLKPSMVIGPSDVVKQKYDLLLVDEAHRLKKRVNITSYQSFDQTNRKLGLDNLGTELDWVRASSTHQVFFYDKNQSVRPADVGHAVFNALDATHYDLVSQLRVEGGQQYIKFIEDLFDLRDVNHYSFPGYDFKLYDNLQIMVDDIKRKDSEFKLCRLVAGYAWSWKTKDGKASYDIDINGVKLTWNSTATDWVNSPNAINEVGCIHTVQGYDLNYVGVIIGPELSYDEATNKLVVDAKKYMDINGKRSITDPKELERYIINIYKTLLTRGIKGVYVYVVDEKLREFFYRKINKHHHKD